jgi:hypothetical protein
MTRDRYIPCEPDASFGLALVRRADLEAHEQAERASIPPARRATPATPLWTRARNVPLVAHLPTPAPRDGSPVRESVGPPRPSERRTTGVDGSSDARAGASDQRGRDPP